MIRYPGDPAVDPPAPQPGSPPPAPPKAKGLKSTLRIAIPIVAMIGVVFGITLFSQYSPNTIDDEKGGKDGRGAEPPLRIFSATRSWDPPAYNMRGFEGLTLLAWSADRSKEEPWRFSVQDRVFPGFYEVAADAVGPKNTATFWFENTHGRSVTMRKAQVSCALCSGGRVAPIPPDVARQILQMSRISILPQGLCSALPLGMAGPAANLHPDKLSWTQHSFRETDVAFPVPPADNPSGWTPQWAILELQFSVGKMGPQDPLAVQFATTIDGSAEREDYTFLINREGVPPFATSIAEIDVGQLNENSKQKQFEIIAYSSTRGPNRTGPGSMGDLSPPEAKVRLPLAQPGVPDEFVTISPPVRVPEQELDLIADLISATKYNRQKQIRVESAYRYMVTVSPRVKDTLIDIGQLERDIWFTLPGAVEQHVAVRGLVTGNVWLDDNQFIINMPAFNVTEGYSKSFKLISARKDLNLKLVESENDPAYMKVTLEKDPMPASSDRGYYILKVTVPSKEQNPQVRAGSRNGKIVLDVEGAVRQRIKIPVKLQIRAQ